MPANLSTRSMLAAGLIFVSAALPALEITRLTWAGIQMVEGDTTLLIDAVGRDIWDGEAPGGFVAPQVDTGRAYAVITHAHNDHFDAESLAQLLGDRGYVICHEDIADYIASRGFRVMPVASYELLERGGFIFTPVPAVDGFGDEQVSWIITHEGKRYLHGGDTLFHGDWARLGRMYGPFEAAFLPVNEAIVPGNPAQESARTMSPEQAVDVALALSARHLVPIHYGWSNPPGYLEGEDILQRLEESSVRRGVNLTILEPGEQL